MKKCQKFINEHFVFWEKSPALFYGISLLIGTSSYLFWPFPWNWVFLLAWGGYLSILRRWQPFILLLSGALYSFCLSGNVATSAKIGYFSCSSLKPHTSPFVKNLQYRGMITVDGQKIPCTVHSPFKEDHPKANCDYILKGALVKRGERESLFRAKEWIPVEKTWSFAEMRFQLKEKMRAFLEEKLQRPRVASFLGSLLTGDVEDRMLRYEFNKLGLQHILAISGFHFAILIAFCSFALGLFLPSKWKYIVLLLMINVYFVFVGTLAAVQRSYLTALFFLIAKLLKKRSSGVNLLGAALFIEVLLDPFISMDLGFQLSFLSCFGILLFRPLFLPFALTLFPKRATEGLNVMAKHGYLLSSFLREAIAITLAVNAALLPLILIHFQSFPLVSFLYNLFYPFLVGLALFLLLFSLLLFLCFPPLSIPCFWLTDLFTEELLNLSSYPPLFLNQKIHFGNFPAWLLPIYLFALFFMAIRKRNEGALDY